MAEVRWGQTSQDLVVILRWLVRKANSEEAMLAQVCCTSMCHLNRMTMHDVHDKPGGPFIAGCCRDCGICHQRFLAKELTAIAKLLTSGHQIVKASESKVPPTATSLNTSQAGESLTEVP